MDLLAKEEAVAVENLPLEARVVAVEEPEVAAVPPASVELVEVRVSSLQSTRATSPSRNAP